MALTLNDNGYQIRLEVPLPTIITGAANSSTLSSVPPAVIDRGSSTAVTVGVTRLAQYPSSNFGVGAIAQEYDFDLPPLPYQIGNTGNNVSRGFQMTDVTLSYFVSSTGPATASNNASTMLMSAFLTTFTDGASFSSGVAYGGTFTYNWGSSTGLSSMGSSGSSNMYNVVCVPAAGTNPFINTDNQRLTFSLTLNNGAASSFSFSIYNAVVHGKWVFGG